MLMRNGAGAGMFAGNGKGKEELRPQIGEQASELVLNTYQLSALQNIHAQKAGITKEHFIARDWFNTAEHLMALNLALTHRSDLSIEEVLDNIQPSTPLQLQAMRMGIDEEPVNQLSSVQLSVLMKFGTPSVSRQLRLDDNFNMAHYLSKCDWLCDGKHVAVLEQMLLHLGYDFMQSCESLKGLSHYHLQVLEQGMRYGVLTTDMHEADWIDREDAALALIALLKFREKDAALAICSAAQHDWQFKTIQKCKQGVGVEEVVQLEHEAQFRAWCGLKNYGLRVEDLKEESAFKSDYHRRVLASILKPRCEKLHISVRREMAAIQAEVAARGGGVVLSEHADELDERLKACEESEVERRRECVATSLRIMHNANELQAKTMFMHKLTSAKHINKLNKYQLRALTDNCRVRLTVADVLSIQWLTSSARLSVLKYFLQDNRIKCLRYRRDDFNTLNHALEAWSDDDFKNVLTAAKNRNLKIRNGVCAIPEVSEILNPPALQYQHGKGCTIL